MPMQSPKPIVLGAVVAASAAVFIAPHWVAQLTSNKLIILLGVYIGSTVITMKMMEYIVDPQTLERSTKTLLDTLAMLIAMIITFMVGHKLIRWVAVN